MTRTEAIKLLFTQIISLMKLTTKRNSNIISPSPCQCWHYINTTIWNPRLITTGAADALAPDTARPSILQMFSGKLSQLLMSMIWKKKYIDHTIMFKLAIKMLQDIVASTALLLLQSTWLHPSLCVLCNGGKPYRIAASGTIIMLVIWKFILVKIVQ